MNNSELRRDSDNTPVERARVLSNRLRDPLHAVVGLAEVLKDAPPDATAQLADTLHAETQRLAELADELLAVLGGPLGEQRPEPELRGLRVLLVDDNPVNQMLTAAQLQKLGHVAIVVSSGPEAIDHLSRDEVDLVLLDWQMPGMDGLEAAELMRAGETAEGRDAVPIVAVTARAMAGDRERCLAAGMNDFLAKPVSLGDLREMLRRWGAG